MKLKKIKKQAVRKSEEIIQNPYFERMVRLGYLIRGFIYAMIGFLALQLGLGIGGGVTNQNGAIVAFGSQPFGRIYLVFIILGLVGYTLWGIVRAVYDPFNKGDDKTGIMMRLGYVVSAISYGILILPTLNFLKSSNQNGLSRQMTGEVSLLSEPWGKYLIMAVGLGWFIAGMVEFYIGYRAKFREEFKTYEMTAFKKKLTISLGRVGRMTRGIIFGMIGYLFFQTALIFDPRKIQGIEEALRGVENLPWGKEALLAVALGLMCFGGYSILGAFWVKYVPKN